MVADMNKWNASYGRVASRHNDPDALPMLTEGRDNDTDQPHAFPMRPNDSSAGQELIVLYASLPSPPEPLASVGLRSWRRIRALDRPALQKSC